MTYVPKFYLLISVVDREILTEIFPTKQSARDEMLYEMREWADVETPDVYQYDNGDYGFDGESAYVTDGFNHSDYDWRIIVIDPPTQILKTE